ncbi:MAG: hypothetical protein Q9183_005866, partial [Haloplaca sp. 2 TL-2023]
MARPVSHMPKHVLRHEKPYKCDFPKCPKVDGFSTQNDLDRHKKSVHKIMPKNSNDRSFRCAAMNCPKKEKIWPRLDNFRQHCVRIHDGENCDELVRKSELGPGMSMEANDVNDSANLVSDDVGIGAVKDSNETPASLDYYNVGHAVQTFRPISPFSPNILPQAVPQTPYQPNFDSQHLLQVPQTNVSRKRPLSPSPQRTLEPPKAKRFRSSDNRSKPSLKGRKPITSSKKAEEVSEELASEIKKCIDLSQWSPENMQAAIKDRVLLALNVDLKQKRPIHRVSSEENVGKSKKRVTCDKCFKTTTTPSEM